MSYLFGSGATVAQQASQNVAAYRKNRQNQFDIVYNAIIKDMRTKVLSISLDDGALKCSYNILNFDTKSLLGTTFDYTDDEYNKIVTKITDFLTKEDFIFHGSVASDFSIQWSDPEQVLEMKETIVKK